MGMNAMKKWEKPELLILVRGRPEDAVLLNCKGNGLPANDPTLNAGGCFQTAICAATCDTQVPS